MYVYACAAIAHMFSEVKNLRYPTYKTEIVH